VKSASVRSVRGLLLVTVDTLADSEGEGDG
jgi:hypothetical protein